MTKKMYLQLVAAALIFQTGTAYKAAVYEHYPLITIGNTPIQTINTNLNEYRLRAQEAEDKGADIIIFPEYGLTTITTDPEPYAIDLTNDDTGVLTKLRAIAIDHGLYLVVNLLEKVKNNSETLYYNTNLVYNRKGNIIAKYRKMNLYNEPKLTPGNEIVTFSTDFGVTFGLITCADILYHTPSQKIFENDKVTDVVFPTAWYSSLPFYSSLSVQYGYAVANGVNLLAANYGRPKQALGGSGIFSGNGQIVEFYIDSSPSSELIVQNVPELAKRQVRTSCSGIVPQGLPIPDQQSNIADFVTLKDSFDSSKYVFGDIDITKEKVSKKVCHKDFCCNFEITIKDGNTNEHYKVLAFDGWVSSDKVKDSQHVRVCSLVACETDSKDSCGARINGTTRFAIHVQGSLPSDELTFYRPLTLNIDLRPIEQINYCSSGNSNDTSNVEVSSTRPQKGVLAFGILGRASSSGVQNMGIVALIIAALAKLILLH